MCVWCVCFVCVCVLFVFVVCVCMVCGVCVFVCVLCVCVSASCDFSYYKTNLPVTSNPNFCLKIS